MSHEIQDHLINLIQVRTGLVLNTHQRDDVAVICADIAGAIPPADTILTALAETPLNHPMWRRLIPAITVGETYFFRNQSQFDALKDHILPELIAERRKSGLKHLRFWAAGCATGEEPYSLAILLRALLPDIETWSITLLATDINEAYLEYARNGVYGTRSFRSETPADLRERWFTRIAHGHQIHSAIRNMVMFKQQNLVMDDYPSIESNTMFMDLIFCRNVTIYFDRATTTRIASRFNQALTTKGWLVVGHSEPQSDVYRGFETRNFKNTVVYQKSGDTPAPVVSPNQQIKPVRAVSKHISPSSSSTPQPELRTPPPPANSAGLSVEALWTLAKTAADNEQWEIARSWLDKAEQQDAFQPQIHYLRAMVELYLGDIDQSLRLLRKAIYCDFNFVLAHYFLGNLYAQKNTRKEAVRHWQQALKLVENMEPQQILPYSDDLTVELLIENVVTRLSER